MEADLSRVLFDRAPHETRRALARGGSRDASGCVPRFREAPAPSTTTGIPGTDCLEHALSVGQRAPALGGTFRASTTTSR